MSERLQTFAAEFINSTRDYIFIRPEDRLLIMRPNKTHHLNATACAMLQMLYTQDEVDVAAVVAHFAAEFGTEAERVEADLEALLKTLAALLKNASSGSMCGATAVRVTPFGTHEIRYPVLSEIALTYRCQHKCSFCYADAPKRGSRDNEMTTAEVRRILDRIWTEAKAPTVSFTGGEPTLREDLPEFIAYAKSLGMRTNLITNGYKCADDGLVAQLAEAGLDSAQVSLEGPTAEVHDAITKTGGSFERSIQGIRNLKARGIHTHTNTTICAENADALLDLVDYIADELGNEYFSMNMVIRTGTAATTSPPRPPSPLHGEGGERLRRAAEGPLHEPVPAYVHELCRELRRKGTPTEQVLWEALRDRRLGGVKFRRQHPLGRYVADFYCAEARLVVEIDGAAHGPARQQDYDAVRDSELAARGLQMMRVRAADVDSSLGEVLNRIAASLTAVAISPLSTSGEGGRGGEVVSASPQVQGGARADVLYHNISAVIIPIIERAKARGLRMVWYSPVPYCLFNPIVHGLGGNSCAAADGLLSIAPDGQVLPCSSFETGIGNLLNEPFDKIWNRRTARYWRNKEFLPPACQPCDMKHICCGACPLYWDEQRGFDELPGEFRAGGLAQLQWKLKRRFIGRVKGVNVA